MEGILESGSQLRDHTKLPILIAAADDDDGDDIQVKGHVVTAN